MANKNFFALKHAFENQILIHVPDKGLGEKFMNCLDAIEKADDEDLFQRIDHSKHLDGSVSELSDYIVGMHKKERDEERKRKEDRPKCDICGGVPKSFMNTKFGDFTVCKKCGDSLILAAQKDIDIPVERETDE